MIYNKIVDHHLMVYDSEHSKIGNNFSFIVLVFFLTIIDPFPILLSFIRSGLQAFDLIVGLGCPDKSRSGLQVCAVHTLLRSLRHR